MKHGALKTRVTFERGTSATDSYGGESLIWTTLAVTWANVSYGTAQERRQAAQEKFIQAVTVVVRWTAILATVTAKDRFSFDGSAWDIDSPPAVIQTNKELHFTARRSS